MARLVEKLSVGLLLVVGIAYAVVPERVGEILAPGFSLMADGLRWLNANVPRPAFILLVFVVTTVVSVLIALSTARVLYTLLKHGGPRTKRAYSFIMPGTPIGKIAVGSGIMILVVFGSVWALPYVVGDLGNDSTEFVNQSQQPQALSVMDGDVLTPGGSESEQPAYRRPRPDADGDRLQNGWEQRGQTPDGVALPDANPQRMDLYVQFNYGAGTIPLSNSEKRRLKQIWADMPVENPDGSTGITLHIKDSGPRAGGMGTDVSISGRDWAEIPQYYTPRYMGDRRCQYHQVVFGTIERSDVGGVANVPGYAAVVKGKPYEYEGGTSARVHIITHELLHNVAGTVDGDDHTTEGWLSPTVSEDDTFLSNATARKLNDEGLAGSGYYQQNFC